MMDYELELGAVIGKPVSCGEGVSATDAGDYIFGFVILNDWSGKYSLSYQEGKQMLTKCCSSTRYPDFRDGPTGALELEELCNDHVSMDHHV